MTHTRLLAIAALSLAASVAQAHTLKDVDHIIVIYTENHSFDNLYGDFPGADGLADAGAAATQVDARGVPFKTLPVVIDTTKKPAIVDPRFPKDLSNHPFDIAPYVPIDQKTGDLVHRFYEEQGQIDGGRMDRFAAISDAGGLTMGHYDGSHMKLWQWARHYTLADHFFHAAFGGSFLNHFWLVCACSPRFMTAPSDMVAKEDDAGKITNIKQATVTPDGFAVNTLYPMNPPFDVVKGADPKRRLPPQTLPTIGDLLDGKGVSWAWYSGGWDDANAGHPDKLFQYHHQPFAYFAHFAPGTAERAAHLKDFKDFAAGIASGNLPHVVFYKPIGELNQHPGYSEVSAGDDHVADLLTRIHANKKLWRHSIVIVTADENGGYWDHVAPPKVDRWGPGTRVPTLIISPFARRGYVDHTIYDTTSILKLIETRYDLDPLTSRDAAVNNLASALDFK